jgi:hypothetical protein
MLLISSYLLAATDHKGHCFSIKHRGQHKLINFNTKFMIQIASVAASEKVRGRPPSPPVAWIYQLHAAGGVSGFTTMVMVFGMSCVLFVQSRLVVIARCT